MQMTESIDDKGDEAIRHRAYMIWLDEGQPDGRAEDHWHQAVAENQEETERRDRPGSPTDQMADKPRHSPRQSATAIRSQTIANGDV
jgi:hypothetical protein